MERVWRIVGWIGGAGLFLSVFFFAFIPALHANAISYPTAAYTYTLSR
jgi:hypothetical protein